MRRLFLQQAMTTLDILLSAYFTFAILITTINHRYELKEKDGRCHSACRREKAKHGVAAYKLGHNE
jgi:hypothetical protein